MSQRDDDIRKRVLQWIAKAEEDFGYAHLGVSQDAPYLSPMAFLSQQCAEKYLKALLVANQIEFPKTHEIAELLDLIASVDADLAESLRDAEALSPYGVDIRYPDDFAEVSPALAKKAFELASKVRDAVRESLRDCLGEA